MACTSSSSAVAGWARASPSPLVRRAIRSPCWTSPPRPSAVSRSGTGPALSGSGFDRDDLEEAGALEADALAAVTNGDNANILTARIAPETYKIPCGGPDLRPPTGRDLPSPRYPDRGHRDMDDGPGRRRLLPTRPRDGSDPTGASLVDARCRRAGPAGAGRPGADRAPQVVAVTPLACRSPRPGVVGQEGDVLCISLVEGQIEALDEDLAGPSGRLTRA